MPVEFPQAIGLDARQGAGAQALDPPRERFDLAQQRAELGAPATTEDPRGRVAHDVRGGLDGGGGLRDEAPGVRDPRRRAGEHLPGIPAACHLVHDTHLP